MTKVSTAPKIIDVALEGSGTGKVLQGQAGGPLAIINDNGQMIVVTKGDVEKLLDAFNRL